MPTKAHLEGRATSLFFSAWWQQGVCWVSPAFLHGEVSGVFVRVSAMTHGVEGSLLPAPFASPQNAQELQKSCPSLRYQAYPMAPCPRPLSKRSFSATTLRHLLMPTLRVGPCPPWPCLGGPSGARHSVGISGLGLSPAGLLRLVGGHMFYLKD